uniref:Zinc finger CCHC-type containing 8 n=1 Tax=Rhinopithecus bieti TaxID=61621 RepID=A0A2K6N5W3_RHIBE
MAAEVYFGDLELFEPFDHPEESIPKSVHTRFKDEDGDEEDENGVGDAELRERLRQCEETIEQLRAENILPAQLKRKLNILTRPSGILVNDSKLDGPILQILFMNNAISKQYHQEIEEFVSNLVKRFEEQQKNDVEKTAFNLLPQPSSIVLEEDHKVEESCAIKNSKEAFSLSEGWEIPKYHQVFSHIVSLEGQEIQVKAKGLPKPHCFNCGSEEHQMKDCPMVNFLMLRKVFEQELSNVFNTFMVLCDMKELSLLLSYSTDGETEVGEIQQNKSVTYDLSKLVNYPGFNISTPRGIPDEWRIFGSIPMQACQQKDVFANYLTSNFQAPGMKSGSKRSSSHSSPGSPKKQKNESNSAGSPADMELDSDVEVPHGSLSSETFQFQPPLPPDTPPLPRGTPPPIFTPPLPKGTSPLTPSDSPQTRTASGAVDEDALTLEELEEQQRRIWAALEQTESVNSDSDIPVDTPLTGNSVASSPCPNELDLPVPEGKTSEKQTLDEPEVPEIFTKKSEAGHASSPDSEVTSLCQKEKAELAPVNPEGAPLDNGSVVPDCDVSNGGSRKLFPADTSPSTATKIHSPIPDMSKFATGITPFEFENMAESTGMYLRIRSLLKNSPRNQQKNKKASE